MESLIPALTVYGPLGIYAVGASLVIYKLHKDMQALHGIIGQLQEKRLADFKVMQDLINSSIKSNDVTNQALGEAIRTINILKDVIIDRSAKPRNRSRSK